jgi:membrane protein YqaA with SNARE-associated domain
MNKLSAIVSSRKFKRIFVVLWVGFYLLTLVIVFDPQSFFRFGYQGVFVFNLIGPGTFLIPVLAQHMNIFLLAFVSAAGMGLNDSISWLAGRSSDAMIPRNDKVRRIESTLQKYGPWGLFVWSLIPFPYDLIGLVAGYMEIKYWKFFLPTFLGKFVRFILLGSGALILFKGKNGI